MSGPTQQTIQVIADSTPWWVYVATAAAALLAATAAWLKR